MAELVTPLAAPLELSGDRRSVEALAAVNSREAFQALASQALASQFQAATAEGDPTHEELAFVPTAAAPTPGSSFTAVSHRGGDGEAGHDLEAYAGRLSGAESDLLGELEAATRAAMPEAAHMSSGHLQGKLLAMLCRLHGSRRVLEVGTFTGYSALCFAQALALNRADDLAGLVPGAQPGEGGGVQGWYEVVTLEVDDRAAAVAGAFFDRWAKSQPEEAAGTSGGGVGLRLVEGDAMLTLQSMTEAEAEAEVDLEAASAKGAFDVVFLDADKRKYAAYLDLLLGSKLVKSGTLVIADNVLWKGRVLGINTSGPASEDASAEPPVEESPERGLEGLDEDSKKAAKLAAKRAARALRRDQVLTQAMHEFNVKVKKDPRLEQVILPIRDGLSIMRVK
mmetsp:Transcript_42687/g.96612  ORF Transcript_42687/g.96612 Transcript_42687/m.96612 type:complete len:395 (+) Transcript_42687:1572-2756(+)